MKEQGFNITIEANQNLSEIQMISLCEEVFNEAKPMY